VGVEESPVANHAFVKLVRVLVSLSAQTGPPIGA
jgi:hypothetical protein